MFSIYMSTATRNVGEAGRGKKQQKQLFRMSTAAKYVGDTAREINVSMQWWTKKSEEGSQRQGGKTENHKLRKLLNAMG